MTPFRAAAVALAVLAAAVGCLGWPERAASAGWHRTAGRGVGQSGLAATLGVTMAGHAVEVHLRETGQFHLELLLPDGGVAAAATASADAGRPVIVTLRDDERQAFDIQPGDTLRLTTGAARVELTVPTMHLRFDRSQQVIAGAVAGAERVRLTLDGAGGGVSREAGADAAGGFRLPFAGPADVVGGRPATVTAWLRSGHRVALARSVPALVASMHPGDLTGQMAPFAPIRAELRDGDDLVAWGVDRGDPEGYFRLWLRDPRGAIRRPTANMTLRVTDGDDVIDVRLPDVAGAYDLATHELRGRGIPGTAVSLTVWNPWLPDEYAQPSAGVDAAGRWTFGPSTAVAAGSHFYITQPLPGGDTVFYCEQIPLLHVAPGQPAVEIETLWDVAASVALARGGETVATAAGRADHLGWLALVPRDPSGTEIAVADGDAIALTLPGASRTVPVRAFTASLTPNGTLEGIAEPGETIALGSSTYLTATVADAAGRFAFDVGNRTADGAPLPGKAFHAYRTTPGGDHIRRGFRGPSLDVRLGAPAVSGWVESRQAVEITIRRPGEAVEVVTGAADALGRFDLAVGAPLAGGETVRLTAATLPNSPPASGAAATEWLVPLLTASQANGVLTGTAPASALLEVHAYQAEAVEPERWAALVQDSATWQFALVDPRESRDFDRSRLDRVEVILTDGPHTLRRWTAGVDGVRRLYLPAL